MLSEEIMNRATALGAYLSVAGIITLHDYPNLRFELQLVLIVSLVIVALVGKRYPGVTPALSLLYVATYLHMSYTSGSVKYVLPYADVAMLSLLIVLLAPAYLFMTKIRRLDDAMTAGCHVVVYVLAIAWTRSLSTSAALFAGLSTLSSGAVATTSIASYLILLVVTTYACQFSAVSLEELKAVSLEFLTANRELLGYEVLLRFSVALIAYLLGLSLVRLVDSRFPVSTKGTSRGTVLELMRRIAIAVPLSLAVTYAFDPRALSLAMVSAYAAVFVGTLSLAKSFQESTVLAYSYLWESRDLVEAIEQKVGTIEEIMKHFGESELGSLASVRETVRGSREAITGYMRMLSSTIPSYTKAARTYETLAKLNSVLDQQLESLLGELRELIKVAYTMSQIVAKRPLALIYEELETTHSKTEKWKMFRVLIPKISEVLRQYCDAMQETLTVAIPSAYYELIGFRPTLRDVESCSDLGVKAIQVLQERVAALLMGFDQQIDSTVEALGMLSEESSKLSRLTGTHEIKNPYVLELLKIYQDHFSYAHTLVTSDLLSKLYWLVDVKRNALSRVSTILRSVVSIRVEIEELNRALTSSLEPVREALAYIDDPDTPLVDLLPILSRVLRTLFNTMGPLSEIGVVVASLDALEKIGPLIEDYIKEGLRQGHKFEEVFPLKDNLRWLWTLLYGSDEENAM